MRAFALLWDSEGVWELVVAAVACLAAAFFAVRLVSARRAYARAVEERGWLLERERESAARGAVDAERARIARELHDIVSHNVSVMVVQAGAARRVLGSDRAVDALLAVESAGRDTMAELRHMLGLLAPSADSDELLEPQPGLSRLGALVDKMCFAGLPVDVRISGEPRPLPSGVDLTAYRIVQEALTNALKHGDGQKAEVLVRYADHHLRVEVLSTGLKGVSTSDGEGRGLLGLRQRVAVLGGDLDARRRLGGGFRVRAKLPVEGP
ncbi:Histidine kinase [Lentzea fradiae]|uniref:histidine kinase n=1 Tax=Lentzea fradiae TaxID=200378 RepID=A0A1G7NSL6_9PSEU|nr:histidine kinase [Lentzea fradiae]SDF76289.1 Histidine kinase [Lentzea fradiae]